MMGSPTIFLACRQFHEKLQKKNGDQMRGEGREREERGTRGDRNRDRDRDMDRTGETRSPFSPEI
jgi:hypothetical protein